MYYLVGQTLGHSISKKIHRLISDIEYDYLEVDSIEEALLKKSEFSGLNVTIPFKEVIIPFLDEIDEHALQIGAVNTVVHNGGLKGYNTDYFGFKKMVEYFEVDIYQKDVLIIGTGGSSKTVTKVLEDLHVGSIEYSSRSGMTVDDIEDKYNIIINTTPVGMYPSEEMILDVSTFSCEVVIDLIYNPLRTRFLQSSECKAINGLYMLVAQAVKAQELFLGKAIDKVDEIYKQLLKEENIVLIGMPMSGKSYLGKRMSDSFGKKLIETDSLIKEFGSIEALFKEGSFRDVEKRVIHSIRFETNTIISTGGGVVLSEDNMKNLIYNGDIVYIERDLEFLKKQDSSARPLLRESGSLERTFIERKDLYKKYATKIVRSEEELYEYLNSKWR